MKMMISTWYSILAHTLTKSWGLTYVHEVYITQNYKPKFSFVGYRYEFSNNFSIGIYVCVFQYDLNCTLITMK